MHSGNLQEIATPACGLVRNDRDIFIKKRADISPFSLASSSSAAPLVCVLADAGELAVGFGHKGLQLLFEQLVSGLGRGGLHGCALGALGRLVLALFPGLEIAAFPVAVEAAAVIVAAEIGAVAAIVLSLGLGLQALDGQVDLAVLGADDHDLDILTLSQVLTDVTDIGIGNLGNMYHAGLVLRQGNKCTEVGDGLDFTLKNGSYG